MKADSGETETIVHEFKSFLKDKSHIFFFFLVRLKQILNVLCDQRKLCHIHYVF